MARQYQASKLAERQIIAHEIEVVKKQQGVEVAPLANEQKVALTVVEAAQKALREAEERHRLREGH